MTIPEGVKIRYCITTNHNSDLAYYIVRYDQLHEFYNRLDDDEDFGDLDVTALGCHMSCVTFTEWEIVDE